MKRRRWSQPAPGKAPMKNPTAVPLRIAHLDCKISPTVGHRSLNFTSSALIFHPFFRGNQHLADAEKPHDDDNEGHPVHQLGNIVNKPRRPLHHVEPTVPRARPRTALISDFGDGFTADENNAQHPHHDQAEIFRRAELQAEGRQRHTDEYQSESPENAGNKGTDGGDTQRRPAATLPRHLVTVEGGYDGCTFTRNIDQDRCRRSAIFGAVIDIAPS